MLVFYRGQKSECCKTIKDGCAYRPYVKALASIADYVSGGSRMEFAKELYNVPLPDRYAWLENVTDWKLRSDNASFQDYHDVMMLVWKFKGAFPDG